MNSLQKTQNKFYEDQLVTTTIATMLYMSDLESAIKEMQNVLIHVYHYAAERSSDNLSENIKEVLKQHGNKSIEELLK